MRVAQWVAIFGEGRVVGLDELVGEGFGRLGAPGLWIRQGAAARLRKTQLIGDAVVDQKSLILQEPNIRENMQAQLGEPALNRVIMRDRAVIFFDTNIIEDIGEVVDDILKGWALVWHNDGSFVSVTLR